MRVRLRQHLAGGNEGLHGRLIGVAGRRTRPPAGKRTLRQLGLLLAADGPADVAETGGVEIVHTKSSRAARFGSAEKRIEGELRSKHFFGALRTNERFMAYAGTAAMHGPATTTAAGTRIETSLAYRKIEHRKCRLSMTRRNRRRPRKTAHAARRRKSGYAPPLSDFRRVPPVRSPRGRAARRGSEGCRRATAAASAAASPPPSRRRSGAARRQTHR